MKKLYSIIAPLVVVTIVLFSCESNKSNSVTDFFKPAVIELDELEYLLNLDSSFSIENVIVDDTTFGSAELAKLYAQPTSKWFDKFGLNENGRKLLTQIKLAATEGLVPDDYFYSQLDSQISRVENLSNQELYETEVKLSYAYLKYAKHLLLGRIAPLKVDKNWQNVNDTTWSVDSLVAQIGSTPVNEIFNSLRPQHTWYKKFWRASQNLALLGSQKVNRSELPGALVIGDSTEKVRNLRKLLSETIDTSLNANSMVWDEEAQGVLKMFQSDFGIKQSGALDSATIIAFTQKTDDNVKRLGMNMERMRWLQKDFLDEYIWVNVPEMDVKYYENDSLTFKMNAVIGKISRKTPTLDSKLSNIVFNPPWFVPPTILKQEIVPGIARRGGSYLRRRGLVARDRRGRVVDASRINSKNYRRYSISQNPGRNSALGSVKFNFPNKEAIFLHDTNHRWGFTKKYRASSSGCIRVHHPKDFACFLLRDSRFSAHGIDSIIKRRATKSVKVKRDIGVHLVYLTNTVDSAGRVVQVNDIYKWDKKLAAKF